MRRPEAVTQTGDALVSRAFALSLQYGGHTNYEGFKTLDTEWDFLAASLPYLLMGNNNRIQIVCDLIDQFLNYTGRWDEAVWLAEQTEILALEVGDKNTAGWRAHQAGWIYFMRDQPDKVLECAKRASLHWDKSSPREKGAAIRLRGLGHKIQEDYPAALVAYREALEIWRTISPESVDVTNVLNDIAIIERINQDYAAAERNYQEILRIDKKNNNQEGIPVVIGNLANVAIERKQWTEAESLAREALALAEKVGRHELIAHDCNYLAKALLKQNEGRSRLQRDVPSEESRSRLQRDESSEDEMSRQRRDQEALSLSRRAVEIFTRLRQQDNLQSAQETLAEIEKAIHR